MPQLDGTGPKKDGKQSGRGLGNCHRDNDNSTFYFLGEGIGLRRKSGGGLGHKRRLKSGSEKSLNH